MTLIQELFEITDRAIKNTPEMIKEGTDIGIDNVVVSSVSPTIITDSGVTTYLVQKGTYLILNNDVDMTITLPTGNIGDTLSVYSGSNKEITYIGVVNTGSDFKSSSRFASYDFYCVGGDSWIIK